MNSETQPSSVSVDYSGKYKVAGCEVDIDVDLGFSKNLDDGTGCDDVTNCYIELCLL